MNLNLVADLKVAAAWLGAKLAPSSPTAQQLQEAQANLPAAEAAIEAAVDEIAEAAAAAAIGQLPEGAVANRIAGPLLDKAIEKLVAKGGQMVAGWVPAIAAAPAPASAEPGGVVGVAGVAGALGPTGAAPGLPIKPA
jgi:hypothetical protein